MIDATKNLISNKTLSFGFFVSYFPKSIATTRHQATAGCPAFGLFGLLYTVTCTR